MWSTVGDKLYKKFQFKNFADALAFINQVGSLAEDVNHHPTIHNTYNIVELYLSTHDAGDKVTPKDKDLAAKIDTLLTDEASRPVQMNFKQLKMYADGGSRGNPGPSASGYVLLDLDNNIVKKSGVYVGITTNNQAEYQSLKFGLQEAQQLGAEEVQVYMDSLLVVNQMKGIFKVKNQALMPHHEDIKVLASQFKKVTFTHVPRELNKLADAEVNETLDAEASRT